MADGLPYIATTSYRRLNDVCRTQLCTVDYLANVNLAKRQLLSVILGESSELPDLEKLGLNKWLIRKMIRHMMIFIN